MKKRIAIVGLYHESNTFSSIPTLWENFADGHIFRNTEIIERFENAHHEAFRTSERFPQYVLI